MELRIYYLLTYAKARKTGNVTEKSVEAQDMLFCIAKVIVAIVGEINEKLLGLARIWSVLRIPCTHTKNGIVHKCSWLIVAAQSVKSISVSLCESSFPASCCCCCCCVRFFSHTCIQPFCRQTDKQMCKHQSFSARSTGRLCWTVEQFGPGTEAHAYGLAILHGKLLRHRRAALYELICDGIEKLIWLDKSENYLYIY